MIHLDDTRKKVISGGRYRTEYRTTCDSCGADRGYLTKQNAFKYPNCRKCSHKNISKETLERMSRASKGRPAWNKGMTGVSEETSFKMSIKKIGRSPANKGIVYPIEHRVLLSCINRGISVDDFDSFTTEESRRERNKFADLGLHLQCFENNSYTCDRCSLNNTVLHAHHKNSWKYFVDQRFLLTNLVSLCVHCHRQFHKIYGINSTEEQYIEFKNTFKLKNRKRIIVVAGVAGSGKSWVCKQLADRTHYHEYDRNPKLDIRSLLWNLEATTIIYDPFSYVSTFIKRNSDIFDIELYVIQESEDVIRDRLAHRNGEFTRSIKRRIERMKNLASRAVFSGTSGEVLEKLKQVL